MRVIEVIEVIESVLLRSPDKGFWGSGDLGFAVQFNAETPWHFAQLGPDSPKSNNRKDNSLRVTPFIPRERPNVKHSIAGYLIPQPTPAPALMREMH